MSHRIVTREVAYESNGSLMIGMLAAPEVAGRKGAALIAHEAPGLSNHTRDAARRLAEIGLVAFAYDYVGNGTAKTDPAEVFGQVGDWIADPTPVVMRSEDALAYLLCEEEVDEGRVAAVGYCFGGSVVLELARTGAQLAAVVGFHPGLAISNPEGSARITAPVLMCLGGSDTITPTEERRAFEDEMLAAGVDWRAVTYGRARHSFTNPEVDTLDMPEVRYDSRADRSSWKIMLDFLRETGVMDSQADVSTC